jgi:hypothetical protein
VSFGCATPSGRPRAETFSAQFVAYRTDLAILFQRTIAVPQAYSLPTPSPTHFRGPSSRLACGENFLTIAFGGGGAKTRSVGREQTTFARFL